MQLLQITIQTSKFDEEINFYQEHTNLAIVKDMRPMGRNMVFLANGPKETSIEIIENPEAADAGNQHLSIGFQSDDVEKMREKLISLGYDATPMVTPMPGVKFFFVKDPAGVTVQFM